MTDTIAVSLASEHAEPTAMIVWPTIGSHALGRLVGSLCSIRLGHGFFTLGKLFAVLTIPLSLIAFAWLFMPFVCRRYRLTKRRIVVEHGLSGKEIRSVGLDEFDAIDVRLLAGQAWLRAGDLLFLRDGREVFRLPGVGRPDIFREICLKARRALLSVGEVVRQQAAAKLS